MLSNSRFPHLSSGLRFRQHSNLRFSKWSGGRLHCMRLWGYHQRSSTQPSKFSHLLAALLNQKPRKNLKSIKGGSPLGLSYKLSWTPDERLQTRETRDWTCTTGFPQGETRRLNHWHFTESAFGSANRFAETDQKLGARRLGRSVKVQKAINTMGGAITEAPRTSR